jgi:hypothetical protein
LVHADGTNPEARVQVGGIEGDRSLDRTDRFVEMPNMKKQDAALIPRLVERRPFCERQLILPERLANSETLRRVPEQETAGHVGIGRRSVTFQRLRHRREALLHERRI